MIPRHELDAKIKTKRDLIFSKLEKLTDETLSKNYNGKYGFVNIEKIFYIDSEEEFHISKHDIFAFTGIYQGAKPGWNVRVTNIDSDNSHYNLEFTPFIEPSSGDPF